MNHKDIKIGMKVVPHDKTADGRVKGLENSAVWKQAVKIGQPYLYITTHRLKDDYPECTLGLIHPKFNKDKNRIINNDFNNGDYFLSSDFERYNKTKNNNHGSKSK